MIILKNNFHIKFDKGYFYSATQLTQLSIPSDPPLDTPSKPRKIFLERCIVTEFF